MKNLVSVKVSVVAAMIVVLSGCGGATPESTSNSSSSSAAAVIPASSSAKSSSAASQMSSTVATDTQAPTMPATLMLGNASTNSVTINWSQSTDNVGVSGYQIYRDNVLLSEVGSNTQTIVDSSVSSNKTYVYGVKAKDAAGNWSTMKTLTVATPTPVGVGSSSSSLATSSLATSSVSSSKASSAVSVVSSSKASSSSSSKSSSSAQSVHSTTLSWTPPSQRENGDPLTTSEIGGYSIRYTSQSTGAVNTMNVPGGNSMGTTVTNLVGTYAFEIATYDTTGLYSDYAYIGLK